MKLKERVAFLTGAAGAGIGQATARLLAGAGASLIVTDAHAERAAKVATGLGEEFGVNVVGIGCDVTVRSQVEHAVAQAVARFGRIDILVNNAGTNRPTSIADMSDETWDLVINTSLRGTSTRAGASFPL